ncbi:MAG: alginate export family protein, partial [Planctomycetes bacterium]|nr:alginate export family protein [Planctomycetota bacterium]
MSCLLPLKGRAIALFPLWVWGLLLLLSGAAAAGQDGSAQPGEEIKDLRERLTEREDKKRVEDPRVIDLFNHPLFVNGQYEISLDYLDRIPIGHPKNRYGENLFGQELELEMFYVPAPALSFFVQFRLIQEEDLKSQRPDEISDFFLERGEMWFHVDEVAGLPLGLEAGRLDFEDDRRWWWDTALDAVRLIYGTDTFEIALAAGEELVSARTDRGYIEPEHDRVGRMIVEASWDWRPNHAFQFFALTQDDRSRNDLPGDFIKAGREDDSDADLTWLGFRAAGVRDFEEHGLLGYWLDSGRVHGDEIFIEISDEPSRRGEVEGVIPRKVRGWGCDLGLTWMLPVENEPRFTLGYAVGSGDGKPDNGTDRGYRQTGLQENEPGFGGVQHFKGYGRLLDPELSNLSILTAGLGCSLFESSSLDLV